MLFQITDNCSGDGEGFTAQLYTRSGGSWASEYVSNGGGTTFAISCTPGIDACFYVSRRWNSDKCKHASASTERGAHKPTG